MTFKNKTKQYKLFLIPIVILIPVLFALSFSFSKAQIANSQLNISAFVVDSEKGSVSNGEYDIRFAIYTTDRTETDPFPSDADGGKRVWQETQKVSLHDGVLNAYLGAETPLPAALNFSSGEYYVGIRIGNDSEMIPRKKIGAVPTAINSSFLNGSKVGTTEGDIVQLGKGGKVDLNLLPTGSGSNQLVIGNDSRLHEQNTDLGTNSSSFVLGQGAGIAGNNFSLFVSDSSANPAMRFNGAAGKWQLSNDGSSFADILTLSPSLSGAGTGISPFSMGDMLYFGTGGFAPLGIGNQGDVLTIENGVPTWSALSVASHGLLSLGHTDVEPGSVSRGDIITGQGTSTKWSRLAIGANGWVLKSDGSDILWAALSKSDVGLGNVENTALSTWTGSTNISTLGTITSGSWNGNMINTNYLTSNVMIEGERIGLLFNDSGYITASSVDTLTNKTWNGNAIGYNYGGLNSDVSAGNGLVKISGGATSFVTDNSSNWDTAYAHSTIIGNPHGLTKTDLGLGSVENTALSTWNGSTNLVTLGTITAGTWNGSIISTVFGGTGLATYTAGDMLYYASGTSLTKLAVGANGQVLTISSGIPTWTSTAPASPHNLLSVQHSDSTAATVMRGDVIVGQGVSPTWSRLALGASGLVLKSDGIDVVWSTLGKNEIGLGNVENTALSTWAGSTNLTTLGTIATGSWSGSAIDALHGGTGISSYTAGDMLYYASGSSLTRLAVGLNGQVLTISSGIPTWTSTAPASPHNLLSVQHSDVTPGTAQRGDLVVAQGVSPTWSRLAIGSNGTFLKSNGADAIWSTVSKSDVGLGSVENTALSTWAGSTNIATVGTVTIGTWNGSLISPSYLASNVMVEGENISLLNNNSGYITASSADTLTNKTWNGNLIGYAYGGLNSNVSTGNGLVKISGGATSFVTDNSSNWDSAYFHSTIIGNPHGTTKTEVGLGNVENTALSTWAGSTNLITLGTVTTGTWNGSVVGVTHGGTGTTTQFTQSSLLFAGASGVYSQDNANLFWDDANNRLGIGTASPSASLDILNSSAINALALKATTTMQQATGDEVAFQLNYTTNKATSGNDTGLLINMTDTASPGSSNVLDIRYNGVSRLSFDPTVAGAGQLMTGYYYGITYKGNYFHASTNQTMYIGGHYNDGSASLDHVKASFGIYSNSSGQFNAFAIKPIYNQTGTAGATDLLINRTQTAIGSGTQLLIDAQVAGTSKFSVTNGGRGYFAGNVGIGTASPNSLLTVAGATAGDGGTYTGSGSVLRLQQNTTWSASMPWTLFVNGYTYLDGFRIYGQSDVRSLYLTRSGGQMDFATNNGVISFTNGSGGISERMRIDTSGNVGIGTVTPTLAKLQVESTSDGIMGMFGDSDGLPNLYITTMPSVNIPSINVDYGYAGDDGALGLNYRGYQNGVTAFRDLAIYNGKGGIVGFFDGSSGNVGIGTAIPQNRLHVYSTTSADGISVDGTMFPAITMRSAGVIKGYAPFLVTTAGGFLTDSLEGDMGFRSEANRILFGVGGASSTMQVTSSGVLVPTGSVGIGTASLGAKLEVDSSTRNAVTAIFKQTDGDSAYSGIGLRTTSASANSRNYDIVSNFILQGDFGIKQSTANGGDPSVSGTTPFYINIDGNVGIGTTNPGKKLEVAGDALLGANKWLTIEDTGSGNGRLVVGAVGSINADHFFIGNKAGTIQRLVVDSSGNFGVGTSYQFSVNSSGAITAATGITSSGTVNFSGLTASQLVATDASKNLISLSSLGVNLGGTGTTTQFTQGSLVFAGASGVYSQKNANLFWDDFNNRLGIGTTTPDSALSLYASQPAISLTSSGGKPSIPIRTYQIINRNTGSGIFDIFDQTSNESRILIDSIGSVGIGDTTPASMFTVGNGDLFQVNSAGAIASATGITSSGTVNFSGLSASQLVATDASKNLISLSSLGVNLGGTGTTTQFTQGSLVFAGASGVYSQNNANLFWDDTNNRLGIGTTNPGAKLEVSGDIKIAGLANSALLHSLVMQNIGTGYDAGSSIDFTNSQSQPIVSQISSATDINGDGFSSYIKFSTKTTGGSGAALADRMIISGYGLVGIGTTNPNQLLHIFSSSSNSVVKAESTSTTSMAQFSAQGENSNLYLVNRINNSATANNSIQNIPLSALVTSGPGATGGLIISSSAASAPIILATGGTATTNERMRIDSSGNVRIGNGWLCVDDNASCTGATTAGTVYAVGAYTTGADYAEYFYTKDTDLKSGEAVCVDPNNDNAIKRCLNDGDNDIMGIVSSNPSIVGNKNHGDDPNYKIIGMIGQVAGLVSAENGPIKTGDSLTASIKPGYMRRANAGESTVGIAMQNLASGKGTIQVLISRRNKSLTVEKVEQAVAENIANMNIQDKVNQFVDDAKATLASQISSQGAVLTAMQLQLDDSMVLSKKLELQMTDLEARINPELTNAKLDLNAQDIAYLKLLLGVGKVSNPGDVEILGKLKAKIVEGNKLVISIEDGSARTIGSAKILKVEVDADNDGVDDETGSDGKKIKIKTTAVSANSRIFVTPKTATDQPLAVVDVKDAEGFSVSVKNSVNEDMSFDWFIVEEK